MKYLLSIILSFLAGCLLTMYIYNHRNITVVENNTTSEEISIKNSISKAYDSVLTVLGYTNSDTISTVGSSFVYRTDDEYAYILTNYHVIKELNKIQVQNNNEVIKEAEILGYDEYMDVAVLKASKDVFIKEAVLADSSNIELGDTVFTVGTPLSEKYYGTVTKGIISYKNRLITTLVDDKEVLVDTIQTSATINPGNSGGPLLNINGEVIGIILSKVAQEEFEGLGFAIPINNIKPIIEKLENGEDIPRFKYNMNVIDLTNSYDLYKNDIYLDKDYEYGIYVKNIQEDSKFKDVLKEKDIVLKVNDINIKNKIHFEYLLNKYDDIKLQVERDNEIIDLEFINES